MGINNIAKQMVEQYQVEKMTEKTSQQYSLFMSHLKSEVDLSENYKEILKKVMNEKIIDSSRISYPKKTIHSNFSNQDLENFVELMNKLIDNKYLSPNEFKKLQLKPNEVEQLDLFQDQDFGFSIPRKNYIIKSVKPNTNTELSKES